MINYIKYRLLKRWMKRITCCYDEKCSNCPFYSVVSEYAGCLDIEDAVLKRARIVWDIE